MREHIGLYRGKRKDNGEWVEGFLFCYADGDVCITREEEACRPEYWVDPDTVGECTGLTDKNGKLIFEGDIVCVRFSLRRMVVKFADGAFYMEGTAVPIKYIAMFEVIGNVHDNPELLGGGDESNT